MPQADSRKATNKRGRFECQIKNVDSHTSFSRGLLRLNATVHRSKVAAAELCPNATGEHMGVRCSVSFELWKEKWRQLGRLKLKPGWKRALVCRSSLKAFRTLNWHLKVWRENAPVSSSSMFAMKEQSLKRPCLCRTESFRSSSTGFVTTSQTRKVKTGSVHSITRR